MAQEPSVYNVLADLPEVLPEEVVQLLTRGGDCRLERIVSRGHASPPGFWYDQDEAEWVVVLRGAARLRFADVDAEILLGPGDAVDIPAHRRHRVEWTTPDEPTVWLALFYAPAVGDGDDGHGRDA